MPAAGNTLAEKKSPPLELTMVAPELRRPMGRALPLPLDAAWVRGLVQTSLRLMPTRPFGGVRVETVAGPTCPLRLYRPKAQRSRAGLLWIHGGGYLIGRAVQDDRLCAATARALGIVVTSVDYRLGPRHPFPTSLDDCHAGWQWLQEAASSLGIDPWRVAVGGQSAGGGLAACLVQKLCNSGASRPAAQWLFAPMLDDRTAARRELDAIDHPVWNNRLNAAGWRALLGVAPGSADVPAYAVAARGGDLSWLPPACIGVGDIDLFHDEDRAYAARLKAAGVDATFDVVAGAPHGFTAWAPQSQITRDHIGRAQAWLGRTLAARQLL